MDILVNTPFLGSKIMRWPPTSNQAIKSSLFGMDAFFLPQKYQNQTMSSYRHLFVFRTFRHRRDPSWHPKVNYEDVMSTGSGLTRWLQLVVSLSPNSFERAKVEKCSQRVRSIGVTAWLKVSPSLQRRPKSYWSG